MGWWYAYGNSRRLCVQLIPEIEKDEIYVDGLSGFFAGIFATLLSHPLDSVSARIMTGTSKHLTLAAATREIIHSEGPMVLWRGLFPSMMGTLVSSTIFALAYEYIKRAASLE